jgi:replication protein
VVAVSASGGLPRRTTRAKRTAEERRERRQDARAQRLLLRRRLRGLTRDKRVRVCGRPGRREDGSVTLRITEGMTTPGSPQRVAGLGGLFHCGSVWLCPECSLKIAAERAGEVEGAIAYYVTRGGTADLVTLTMRHHKGDRLKKCWDAVTAAWRAVNTGAAWQEDKKELGLAGYVRAIEPTVGLINGWHVHAHVVLIYEGQLAQDVRRAMAERMFERWSAALVAAGFEAPDRDNHGLDVQHLSWAVAEGKGAFESIRDLARYVAKGMASEATMGAHGKTAKNNNRTMMELLRDAVTPAELTLADDTVVSVVDDTARQLWAEYERAAKGRKQLTWSRGLRAKAGLDVERSAQEIVETELEGETIAVLPGESFEAIETRVADLLAVAETGGRLGAYAWLEQAGVTWWRPTRLTDSQVIDFRLSQIDSGERSA